MRIVCCFLILLFLSIGAKANDKKLSPKEQSLVRISAVAAVGELEILKKELHQGLDDQLTINEIKEGLIHLYAYAGFPRSLRGLQTFMRVLDERKEAGVVDVLGPESTPVHSKVSKYATGKDNLEKLTGIVEGELKKEYAVFAPTIEVFLKEHLFADIFERDVLDYKQRELITISILAALGNVQPMLKSHMTISLNVGYSQAQLEDFISIIRSTSGDTQALEAQNILNEIVLTNKP